MPNSIHSLDFREHFIGGDGLSVGVPGMGNATAGQTGWSWEVGNVYDIEQRVNPGEPNHPGIAKLRTRGQGTEFPSYARLSAGGDNAFPVHPQNITRFRSILRIVEPDGDGDFTDEGIFTGFGTRPNFFFGNSDLGNDGIYFSFRPNVSSKWQAGCQATVDPENFTTAATLITSSGPDVALDTWYVLEAVQAEGSWEFFVDGDSMGSVNTNVPTISLTPMYRIVTQMQHPTGYMIQLDCDEFAYRLAMDNPGLPDW